MDIFTNDGVTPPVENVDSTANALEALVGEGKKFKDPEALAKGKLASDQFIEQLQRELAELRESNKRALTLEEVKTQILSGLKPQEPAQVQPNTSPEPKPQSSENIEEVVSKIVETREAQAKAKANRDSVSKTMTEKFGADAPIILKSKAAELGVSTDYLAKVATDSPSAFFRLIGVETNQRPAPQVAAPRNQTVTPLQSAQPVERTASWYAAQKKNAQSREQLRALQQQEMKDALKLGEAYFD